MNYGKLALKRLEALRGIVSEEEQTQVPTERRLHIQLPRMSSITEFSRQIRFKTASSGSVTITAAMTVSRSVTLEIYLDGELSKRMSYSNYTTSAEVVCAGISAGVHVAEVKVTSSTFNLNFFSMTVSGNLVIADDDTFIDGFDSDVGYLVLNHGQLLVYSLSGILSTLACTYYGVKVARTVGSAIVLLTETGEVCVMTDALTSQPGYAHVCSGGNGVGGVALENGNLLVFVSKSGVIETYCYVLAENKVVYMGEQKGDFSSASARLINDKIYIACNRLGGVELIESEKTTDYQPAERFTVRLEVEVA